MTAFVSHSTSLPSIGVNLPKRFFDIRLHLIQHFWRKNPDDAIRSDGRRHFLSGTNNAVFLGGSDCLHG